MVKVAISLSKLGWDLIYGQVFYPLSLQETYTWFLAVIREQNLVELKTLLSDPPNPPHPKQNSFRFISLVGYTLFRIKSKKYQVRWSDYY